MPGVADAQRKTQLKQEQQARKRDHEELIELVREGRIHEADERQLEMIKLALELKSVMEPKEQSSAIDPQILADAVGKAVENAISKAGPIAAAGGNSTTTSGPTGRPSMRHVDLTNIQYDKTGVEISHGDSLSKEESSEGDGAQKLQRLRKLKGQRDDSSKD